MINTTLREVFDRDIRRLNFVKLPKKNDIKFCKLTILRINDPINYKFFKYQ